MVSSKKVFVNHIKYQLTILRGTSHENMGRRLLHFLSQIVMAMCISTEGAKVAGSSVLPSLANGCFKLWIMCLGLKNKSIGPSLKLLWKRIGRRTTKWVLGYHYIIQTIFAFVENMYFLPPKVVFQSGHSRNFPREDNCLVA